MARNGSGAYSLPVNTWNPATNGVAASAADWQALANDIASALTASVAADGQTPMTGNLAMGSNKLTGLSAGTAAGNSLRWEQLFSQGVEADIASATTTDIGAQTTNFLRVTGTTTITGFGTNYNGPRFLRFADALTLTNGSALSLPGGANITTAAGDRAIAIPKATSGTPDGWIVLYQKASGLPASTTGLALSGANTDITSLNAPALGAATATTQAAATSNTTVATTAFVQQEVPAASTTAAGKAELATTAETEAGSDTGRVVTPAGLKGALGFSNGFLSADQTITPNSTLNVAHGLGARPYLFNVVLKCIDAGGEAGFAQNDEAQIVQTIPGVSVISASADATNVIIGYTGASTYVLHKTTQVATTITSAKWAFVVRAWV
jgi:hypothetical protein